MIRRQIVNEQPYIDYNLRCMNPTPYACRDRIGNPSVVEGSLLRLEKEAVESCGIWVVNCHGSCPCTTTETGPGEIAVGAPECIDVPTDIQLRTFTALGENVFTADIFSDNGLYQPHNVLNPENATVTRILRGDYKTCKWSNPDRSYKFPNYHMSREYEKDAMNTGIYKATT